VPRVPTALRSPAAGVLAIATMLAFAFQGTRPLWEPDEGRYTNVALEMLRSGDFIVPRLHPELTHYTKPPLTYWTLAASIHALGRNAWASRVPIALVYLATVALMLSLGRRLTPGRAWLPALVYATMLLPFVAGNVVTTDTLLALGTGVAGVGFTAWLLGRPESRAGIRVMWLGYGLAFLTKGPPGLLTLPAFLLTAGIARTRSAPRLADPLGLALFAAIALPWFLLVVARDPALASYFVVDETLKRVGTGHHHRNAEWYGAFTVYVPTLLLGALPWTWWLLRGLPGAGRALKLLVRGRVAWVPVEDLLLGLWVAVPLTVFALARSRLAFYLLPVFMPLAVIAARRIPAAVGRTARSRFWLGAWMVLLLGAKLAATWVPAPGGNPRTLAAALRESIAGPVGEVVFVEMRPVYALSLYLDTTVERITLARPAPGVPPPLNSLDQELGEVEHDRVFVVEVGNAERFRAEADTLGFSAVPRGGVPGRGFYELVPRDPGS